MGKLTDHLGHHILLFLRKLISGVILLVLWPLIGSNLNMSCEGVNITVNCHCWWQQRDWLLWPDDVFLLVSLIVLRITTPIPVFITVTGNSVLKTWAGLRAQHLGLHRPWKIENYPRWSPTWNICSTVLVNLTYMGPRYCQITENKQITGKTQSSLYFSWYCIL
jgi:hypothetical protein